MNRGRFRRPEERVATGAQGVTSDTYGYVGPTETAFETGASGTRSLLDVDGSRLAVKNGSTVSWVIFDLHGSVAALCPAGGSALSDAYRYDAWGQTIASWSSATPAANPWKYRGLLGVAPGQTDLLYDMVARDYSPSLGTFTSLDSVQGGAANPMTMNRYVYALANPATFVDPDGRATCEKDPCQGGGSAVRTPGGTIYGVDSRGRWQRKVASAWDRDETSIPGWAVDACGPSCELAPQMIQVARDYDYFLALYTGCKVDGGGNPSTVLMCLHAQVGDYDVGDAAFYTFFKPSEYDSGGPVAEAVNLIILLLTGREILKGADEGAALAMRALRSERAASAATAIDELFLARFGNLRISIGSGGARVDALRNAGDVSVTGRTPADPLSLDRQIGSSMWQEVSKTKLIEELEAAGASDFKVNQWQELGGGASVVGRNRPDLQFTFGNRRYYVEWDNDPGSALLHEARILLNDPGAMFISFVP